MEEEVLETDVLIVGGGPAGLTCAIKISQLFKNSDTKPEITVIEKARDFGMHQVSGAIFDPVSLRELLPNFDELNPPLNTLVSDELVYYVTDSDKYQLPVPPFLSNHDNYVISLGQLTKWLSEIAEKEGIMLFPDTPGDKLMEDDKGNITGVITKEKGIDKNGEKKPNYQPGFKIKCKLLILSEGTLGTLTRKTIKKFKLDEGKQPQLYATGTKELWQSKKDIKPGAVIHTLGYPLSKSEFGGSFLYTYKDNKFCIGMVVGLDYEDPSVDIHYYLQKFKQHPQFKGWFTGAELLEYGAKTIPEGGYFSVPKLYGNNFLILGDSAGFVNVMRLKGIHLAIKSGILAAETAADAINSDNFNEDSLKNYELNVRKSYIWKELKRSRSFRSGFKYGPAIGLLNSGLSYFMGGFSPLTKKMDAGYTHMKKQGRSRRDKSFFDDDIYYRKLTDVYHSKTNHEENSPSHLIIKDPAICSDRCKTEYGNPCENFCPASVYEYVKDEGQEKVQINFTNCVHCKTCDIMDPYQVIEWVAPEGGGPAHTNL